MNTFPKQPAHAGHVAVKMKRKKEYKNDVHCASYVKPELLFQSLKVFKEKGHPSYQDITLLLSYEPMLEFDPELEEEEQEHCNKKDTTPSEKDEPAKAGLFLQHLINFSFLI